MGWKLLKDRFAINHIVQVRDGRVLIGSPYVGNLAEINPKTGTLYRNPTFPRFLDETYPALASAEPAEIIAILAAQDSFSASLPVWTYDGAKIIEQQCEERGYPNVTHDGTLQYNNAHFDTQDKALARAKQVAKADIEWLTKSVAEAEERLTGLRNDLARSQDVLNVIVSKERT